MTDLEPDKLMEKVESRDILKIHKKHFRTKIEFYEAMKEIGFLPYDPTMEED